MARALTMRAVEAAKPGTARREIADGGLPGLYLVVQPSGAKSWALRYRHGGRTRKLTIGKHPLVSLASARAKARDAVALLDMGEDPAAERVVDDRFATLVADYIDRHLSRRKSAHEVVRLFNVEVLPMWSDRKAADISRRDVIDLLDRIVDRGAPYTANRTLAALRGVFNWAISRDRIDASPCAGISPPGEERVRERVLSDDEIAAFWRATGALGYPFGPLMRLLLLTGARRDEVAAMRWDEISGDIWTLPGERTKNGREHVVYLSRPAMLTLAGVPRRAESPYVFTTTTARPVSGYSKAKKRLDYYMGDGIASWRVHDLRRTIASGMARLGISLPVIEKCLNHVSGSFAGIVGVYQKHDFADEKRAAWAAWADHIMQIAGDDATGLVPFLASEK